MTWRRWPWLEEGVLPLMVLLLRLSWLWPWLLLLQRWLLPPEARPLLPLWIVALLLLGGALATHLLPVDPKRPRRARLLAAGIGLAALALTLWLRWERDAYALWDIRWIAQLGAQLTHWADGFSAPFLTLLLAAFLWLRGMRDNPAPSHDDVWRTFVAGFIALALLLLAGRIDPAGPPDSIARWIMLFFAAGMAALALAGLRLARNVRQQDAPLLANRYWLAGILVTILVLLGLGIVLGFIITPEGMAQVFGWTRIVGSWILSAVGYLAYAVAYVLFLFLTPLIEWLAGRMGEPKPLEMGGAVQQFEDTLQGRTPLEIPPAVDESLRWLGLAGVLAVIAVVFGLALYMLRRREEEELDETREIILTAELLRGQAADLWRRLRDRLFHDRAGEDPFLSLEGEEPLRRAVREAYRHFLAAMALASRPRHPRQTPAAYAQDVSSALPGAATPVAELTDRYVAARYGASAPDAAAARRAEEAWAEIQAQLAADESAHSGRSD